MAFWRGETLESRLPNLIEPYRPDHIDCAAYELTLGDEVFVTSDGHGRTSKSGTKSNLKKWLHIQVPPGQFAFLITRESVRVPSDAIAFISMKTGIKWKGLVNVSGFHVDPGWAGHLTFGVYNAGPAPVHMTYGERMFLIWYASLDHETNYLYKNGRTGASSGKNEISNTLVNGMAGEVFSPAVLGQAVRGLSDKVATLQKLFWTAAALIFGAIFSLLAFGLRSQIFGG